MKKGSYLGGSNLEGYGADKHRWKYGRQKGQPKWLALGSDKAIKAAKDAGSWREKAARLDAEYERQSAARKTEREAGNE